ncbi:MAG: hypothetical protein EWV75_10405 [Microcystis wesenbergii Mw_QC_S_20081001_S30D]|uniref:Uncharacterized protein n=1 Tax=Microcystis wesenbergii Mw_QC_S_20081001_S30D TaxID=2486245 RepID=A0A552JM68_9CHRO|nr:hypothetical protein [Microcystis aeruginosa W11-03]NCR93813.1 hypothetical protein [Microcystis aeruginosa W11-06]TRU95074.1 MAG: hypothetical protein EWV73_21200 [Microcystis wesenbergii Mw_QC_B_20070930_S4D]TRU96788.1 MAG: hypothetical protein EWV75_10405 [Microcystis wesenbergii Mw_QC_S_20081001_S30D]TRU98766.1 MAG: hypothetical protein EWV74_15365 [Microcystis wesenbergii Mw_QC_S_20081001_S30]TRV08661.1 MAG: hypothetical protein EWV89_20240 [Microcystis wesenbergii Mw_QC_B_20070930_S4]
MPIENNLLAHHSGDSETGDSETGDSETGDSEIIFIYSPHTLHPTPHTPPAPPMSGGLGGSHPTPTSTPHTPHPTPHTPKKGNWEKKF